MTYKLPHNPGVPDSLQGEHGFQNFLYLAWKAIGLPEPTPVQYDIAYFMQHGGELSNDRIAVQGFRGVGKSYIAAAFTDWVLLLAPNFIIQVVSGSKVRADDFSHFTLQLLEAMGELTSHMMPREGQRMSRVAFDVATAPKQKDPSVTSKGLFSQLTGGRADIIISDDCVTKQNSATPTMREKIKDAVEEFNAILKPGGRIMYLMTPQSEEDLAHELPSLGYDVRIWPVEVPPEKVARSQGDRLAPMIRKMIDDNVPVGTPTDPLRFDEEDIEKRRIAYGRVQFAMQFLLDQSLADAERFPLRLSDLIIDDLNPDLCYEKYIWTQGSESRLPDPPCPGFTGDFWHKPMDRVGVMVPYSGIVMSIDPSGRGKDETAYAVVACYAGQMFVLACGGLQGGYSPEVLLKLTTIAKKFSVRSIVIEENFGQGMFESLLTPVLNRHYRCSFETVRHNKQKEHRITDVLEPVISSHRMVVDRQVLENDWESVKVYAPEDQRNYLLGYQMSRITRERGALKQDDRLDALAMAVQYWIDALQMDTDKAMVDRRDRELDDQIADFLKGAIGGPSKPPSPVWAKARIV